MHACALKRSKLWTPLNPKSFIHKTNDIKDRKQAPLSVEQLDEPEWYYPYHFGIQVGVRTSTARTCMNAKNSALQYHFEVAEDSSVTSFHFHARKPFGFSLFRRIDETYYRTDRQDPVSHLNSNNNLLDSVVYHRKPVVLESFCHGFFCLFLPIMLADNPNVDPKFGANRGRKNRQNNYLQIDPISSSLFCRYLPIFRTSAHPFWRQS